MLDNVEQYSKRLILCEHTAFYNENKHVMWYNECNTVKIYICLKEVQITGVEQCTYIL